MEDRSGAKLTSYFLLLLTKQATATSKSPPTTFHSQVARVAHTFKVGDPCYALYCGPRRNKDPRWVPAVVTKVFGPRSVNVLVFPHGATWRRHVEQLQYRYGSLEDSDPGELPAPVTLQISVEPLPSNDLPLVELGMLETTEHLDQGDQVPQPATQKKTQRNPRLPTGNEYSPNNPRRSTMQEQEVVLSPFTCIGLCIVLKVRLPNTPYCRPLLTLPYFKADREVLRELLQGRFAQVFSNKPGKTSLSEHRIETESSKPVRLPPYRLPHAYIDSVKKELAEMERNGIIEPACSEWASPVVVA
ncbi:hypothetical protein EMCRGX_G009185 [Ephydatia muelleri]